MDSMFKQTLRAELNFQDIRVKELAYKTGISQRTIEGYLSARGSIPPADVAVKIADALRVSVEYLVTGNASREAVDIPPRPAIEAQPNRKNALQSEIAGLPPAKLRLVKSFVALLRKT